MAHAYTEEQIAVRRESHAGEPDGWERHPYETYEPTGPDCEDCGGADLDEDDAGVVCGVTRCEACEWSFVVAAVHDGVAFAARPIAEQLEILDAVETHAARRQAAVRRELRKAAGRD
jgi:hypothetical protein